MSEKYESEYIEIATQIYSNLCSINKSLKEGKEYEVYGMVIEANERLFPKLMELLPYVKDKSPVRELSLKVLELNQMNINMLSKRKDETFNRSVKVSKNVYASQAYNNMKR